MFGPSNSEREVRENDVEEDESGVSAADFAFSAAYFAVEERCKSDGSSNEKDVSTCIQKKRVQNLNKKRKRQKHK